MGKGFIRRIALMSLLLGQMVCADDHALIRRQFIEYYVQQPESGTTVRGYLETQQPDGTWTDIDYASQRRCSWPTLDHLQRIQIMATAYAYTIYPMTEATQMKTIVDAHQTKILSNTETLQAIEGANGVRAVFYKRGKLKLGSGKVLTVDAPCMLSLQEGKLIVCDPAHSRSRLRVSVGTKHKTVKLLSGINAGQQVVVQ